MKQLICSMVLSLMVISCQKPIEGDILIENINVVDVQTGDVHLNMDVLIIADSIAEIKTHRQLKYSVRKTINGSNKFLIPGLWDMHGHWIDTYEYFFPMLLANGVTGIRDMWGNLPVLTEVREKIKKGELIGPEVLSAGFMVAGVNPIQSGASVIASTPEEGREIVRNQKSSIADFTKVYSELERDVYFAIAEECKIQDLPLTGHIPTKTSLYDIVNSNHRSVEHVYGINAFLHNQYEEFVKKVNGQPYKLELDETVKGYAENYGIGALEYDLENLEISRLPQLIKLLANSQTWITPTLVVEKGRIRTYDPKFDPGRLNAYMPDHVISDYYVKDTLRTSRDSTNFQWDKKYYNLTISMLKPMFDGGVKFLAGTDYVIKFCYPGFSLHEELQILVEEAGITPLQALQTATINPAMFLEMEDKLGTVEIGKKASLLILNQNPMEDIKSTQDIGGLILRGDYYNEQQLDIMLAELLEKNKKPQIRSLLDSLITSNGVEFAIEKYHNLKKETPGKYNFDQRQLVSLGHSLLENGQINEAIRIFELNTKTYPKLSHSFNGLGDAYFENGDMEKARTAWLKANELGGYTTFTKLAKLDIQE